MAHSVQTIKTIKVWLFMTVFWLTPTCFKNCQILDIFMSFSRLAQRQSWKKMTKKLKIYFLLNKFPRFFIDALCQYLSNYWTKSTLKGDQSINEISYYIKYTKFNFDESEHQMENKNFVYNGLHCASHIYNLEQRP